MPQVGPAICVMTSSCVNDQNSKSLEFHVSLDISFVFGIVYIKYDWVHTTLGSLCLSVCRIRVLSREQDDEME